MSQYEILVDVPIPQSVRHVVPRRSRKYPLDVLRVGEMFFIPHRPSKAVAPHISVQGKRLGRKFAVRMLYMYKPGLFWEPADEETPGATFGTGVWRVK